MVQVGSVVIKHVEGIGIYNIQPGESIFNRRNVGVLFIYGQAFLPVTAYLVFGATTMLEFEQCFFLWISLSATTVGFFVTILKTRNLFETLDYANNFLEKRKCIPCFCSNVFAPKLAGAIRPFTRTYELTFNHQNNV